MSKITIQEISNIREIPSSTFEELGCADSFYFSKQFIEALESQNEQISNSYCLFFKNDNPIALAILQHINIDLEQATEQLSLTGRLGHWLRCILSNKKTSIIISGNVFLSGDYGVFVKDGVKARSIYELLSQKFTTSSAFKTASVYFLKDFNAQQDQAASIAEKYKFQSFAVEPNMKLDVRWESFQAYKNDLKSKYRVKVNKADSSSERLEVLDFTASEIRTHLVTLQNLYENVSQKALFNAVNLNIEMYAVLKDRFRESVLFYVYKKQNHIVGFLTAFYSNEILNAHFIGIDYEYNKTDAIYPRILNDYIRLGIKLGAKTINLGRTASEIKSTLGATPEHLRCYVRHKRTLANRFFKPALKQIKMTEYKQHTPFKK